MLRQFAVDLDADMVEDIGAARLDFNNDFGKGTISLYEMLPGVTAWVYRTVFNEDYNFSVDFSEEGVYSFGYHISGHQMTRFSKDEEFQKIKQGQNFIIKGNLGASSDFLIPAGITYECCYLIIAPDKSKDIDKSTLRRLTVDLEKILVPSKNEGIYRYFGEIDLKTGHFAEYIIKNKRTDLVGRLLLEAAILNMLGAQITSHDADGSTMKFEPEMSKKELYAVAKIGDYIKENLDRRPSINELCMHVGLSPKKLQDGVRSLYGYSVNEFTSNIRLKMSKELIDTTDLSISQICSKVGYSSRSYFSKVFKKKFGVYPKEYQQSYYFNNVLFELSYRSKASNDISEIDLNNILQSSRLNNSKKEITGILVYYNNEFFQLIEGPKKQVLMLYESIKMDKNHWDVKTMWKGTKNSRDFEDWGMAFLADRNKTTIDIEGDIKELHLDQIFSNADRKSLLSETLWRKVRNTLKVS